MPAPTTLDAAARLHARQRGLDPNAYVANAFGVLSVGHNQPAGCVGASIFDRSSVADVTVAANTSGTARFVRIPVTPGDLISNVTFVTGTTAGATLTHRWAALYSATSQAAQAQLALSADDVTASWAINTAQTFAFTTPYLVPTGIKAVYAVLTVVGTTMPTLAGVSTMGTAVSVIADLLSFDGTASLTTPATAPASNVTVGTGSAKVPYAYLT